MLLLLLGCSSPNVKTGFVDPEIQPYVKEFIDNSEGKVTPEDIQEISITFKDYGKSADKGNNGTIVGTCHLMAITDNYITINTTWWHRLDDPYYHLEKASVVWHELGHCALLRDHTPSNWNLNWWDKVLIFIGLKESEKTLTDGCPISLMNPYTLDSWCWNNHYNYYIKELYDQSAENYKTL
jgi:hypothetical protein